MSYNSPFTGNVIQPTDVSYRAITITNTTLQLEWPINGNTDNVVANIIEVTATLNTNLKLYMPPATSVSTGQSVLIRNIGSFSFTVVDTSGNTIVSIASGIAQYIISYHLPRQSMVEFINLWNPLVETLLFDIICWFDDHTWPQYYFVDDVLLDAPRIYFYIDKDFEYNFKQHFNLNLPSP